MLKPRLSSVAGARWHVYSLERAPFECTISRGIQKHAVTERWRQGRGKSYPLDSHMTRRTLSSLWYHYFQPNKYRPITRLTGVSDYSLIQSKAKQMNGNGDVCSRATNADQLSTFLLISSRWRLKHGTQKAQAFFLRFSATPVGQCMFRNRKGS